MNRLEANSRPDYLRVAMDGQINNFGRDALTDYFDVTEQLPLGILRQARQCKIVLEGKEYDMVNGGAQTYAAHTIIAHRHGKRIDKATPLNWGDLKGGRVVNSFKPKVRDKDTVSESWFYLIEFGQP